MPTFGSARRLHRRRRARAGAAGRGDWQPAVKANLEVTLKHAALVAEFELPDDAEPAPVFTA